MNKTLKSNTNTSRDRKVILSLLWIFAMFNYTYADIFGLMDSTLLNQYLTGSVDGMIINETILFYGVFLMEIPIAMIILSRVLPYRLNRLFNIIAAIIKTLAVSGTLFMGESTMYYSSFAIIELATTLFIIWYAWTWKNKVED